MPRIATRLKGVPCPADAGTHPYAPPCKQGGDYEAAFESTTLARVRTY